MIQHIVFLCSYLYYVVIYLRNCEKIIYPLYFFPVFVYLFLFLFSYLESWISHQKLSKIFRQYSKFLYFFWIFFISSFLVKLNLPDPHNFIQRKFEIMLGASFATFVCLCAIKFAFELYKNIDMPGNQKKMFYVVVLYFFVFFAGVSLWFNYANPPTGDEPEYIMMAHSLIYDRDLDLKNNFENKDYKKFYPDKELKIQDAAIKKKGKILSYHPFMVSVIIAPFYFSGQRLGVTIFINLISAFLVGLIFLIILNIFNDKLTAFFTSLFAGFSLPVLIHINHIATDMLSALFITLIFFIILFAKERYFLFSFLVSISIWLHFRNIPVAFMLFLIYVFYNKNSMKIIFITLTFQIINLVLLFIVNNLLYGSFLPSQGTKSEHLFGGFNFDILNSFSGIFFDQEFGLFFYTPLFILLPAGFYFLFKFDKRYFWIILFTFLPYLVFICSWSEWRGGGGSSPRFFVPVIIFLLVPISFVFYYFKTKFLKIFSRVLTISGFFVSFIMLLIPWFRWNKGDGHNWILKIISSILKFDLTSLFPSIWSFQKHTIPALIFWGIFVVVINLLVIFKYKHIDK